MRRRLSGTTSGSILGITMLAVFGVTSACTDSGSDSVGPSAVATGGENGRIKLEATISERSGTCPSIRLRLGSLIVETTSTTDFEIPCAQAVTGLAVEAHAPIITGNELSAREVDADPTAASNPNFEAEGPIAIVSPSNDCTGNGRDVTIQGLTFRVGEDADFRDIGGCSALAVGLRVRARGPLATSSGAGISPLRATRVERR